MNIAKVKKEIEEQLSYIPDWINTKSSIHKKVWNIMNDCQKILFLLVTDKIIKEKSIEIIINKFAEYILEIIDISGIEIHILLYKYFTSVLEYMIHVCLEYEEYEAAANLRNFNDLYFHQNISDDNE